MEEYPPEFEEVWREYPKRNRADSKKDAFRTWKARVKAGDSKQDLLAATKEYSAVQRRLGKWGTEFVMRASTFFGPYERWCEFLPKAEVAIQTVPPSPRRECVVPRRIERTEAETTEGLIAIRGILQALVNAKSLPKEKREEKKVLTW